MVDKYSKSIKKFKELAFCNGDFFLSFFSKNQKYLRYSLYKNYCLCFKYKNSNMIGKIIYLYRKFKYLRISSKINVQLPFNEFVDHFYFNHYNIVISKKAIIGKNCNFVGNNCVGGNSKGEPKLGEGVYLGYGAIVIGNVEIAEKTVIGAGAIITKDILKPGSYVVGLDEVLK
ncbi:MAG: hypothetical protein IKP77_02405 [Acholeplasmatales bacterium]|nr:hypothetical protein [Acholeplasmatales bacterium]